FLLSTILLLAVGFLALISASSGTGARIYNDPFYYVKQQYLLGLGVALLVGFLFYKIPHHFWQKTSVLWLGLSLILVLLAFIPQLASEGTTARRWLKIGPLSLQPSEVLRFFYIIFLAAWLAKNPLSNLKSFKRGVFPFILILAFICIPLLLQPATSIVALIGLTALAMYLVAGMRLRHLFILLLLALILGSCLLVFGKGYRLERFLAMFFPEKTDPGKLQQQKESLEGIGSGKLLGVGYFNSIKKYQYLPSSFVDYIFAIFAEENGFLVSLFLILLYLTFISSGFSLALNASDLFTRYAVIGLIFSIGFQALTAIAVNIGLLPVTGVPLPFISYGKSNLVVMAMSIGFILNTAKRKT
ncbi:MAG: FtsW/RodA/SpoVE family cell cycle protein, partial [Candidatus Parcubacteria bacterium]|nr:FtsW/RodA/SpoVE family cell cycle protein [Candidatus Parcubacteria bacterium]